MEKLYSSHIIIILLLGYKTQQICNINIIMSGNMPFEHWSYVRNWKGKETIFFTGVQARWKVLELAYNWHETPDLQSAVG